MKVLSNSSLKLWALNSYLQTFQEHWQGLKVYIISLSCICEGTHLWETLQATHFELPSGDWWTLYWHGYTQILILTHDYNTKTNLAKERMLLSACTNSSCSEDFCLVDSCEKMYQISQKYSTDLYRFLVHYYTFIIMAGETIMKRDLSESQLVCCSASTKSLLNSIILNWEALT